MRDLKPCVKKTIKLLPFLLVFLAISCSVGIDPTEDPVQPSGSDIEANANENLDEENENEANNANIENAESGNTNNSGNNTASNNNGSNSEAPNNSNEENFLNGGGNANLFGNNQGNNNLLGNQGNNNLGLQGENDENGENGELVNGAAGNGVAPANNENLPLNENTDINAAATDNTVVNPAPENTVVQPEVPEEVAEVTQEEKPSVSSNTSPTGVVKYVLAGGSKLHNRPNGDIIKELEQGDHPLVNAEGEWARTSDGYYIPSQTLTTEPIGRLKQPKEWR